MRRSLRIALEFHDHRKVFDEATNGQEAVDAGKLEGSVASMDATEHRLNGEYSSMGWSA